MGATQRSVSRECDDSNESRYRWWSARARFSTAPGIGSATVDEEHPCRHRTSRRRCQRLRVGTHETRAGSLAQRALRRMNARACVVGSRLDVRRDHAAGRGLPFDRRIRQRRDTGQRDLHGGQDEDQPARSDGATCHELLRGDVERARQATQYPPQHKGFAGNGPAARLGSWRGVQRGATIRHATPAAPPLRRRGRRALVLTR